MPLALPENCWASCDSEHHGLTHPEALGEAANATFGNPAACELAPLRLLLNLTEELATFRISILEQFCSSCNLAAGWGEDKSSTTVIVKPEVLSR
jgi:hypothetical protein